MENNKKEIKIQDNKPLVVVRTLVYNHEQYLHECLENILSQKTNFKFVIVVHDDCSTDNSASIIKQYAEKYPEIIIPILEEENQYSKDNDTLGKIMDDACRATGAKYMAFCEGDDYWTNPDKLQIQIDYMESHPECGLTYGKYKAYIQSEHTFRNGGGEPTSGLRGIIDKNVIGTLTTVIKFDSVDWSLVEKYRHRGWPLTDFPLWLNISLNHKLHFIDEEFATYRILSNSMSHPNDYWKDRKFVEAAYEIKFIFLELAGILTDRVRDEYMQKMYDTLLFQSFSYRERKEALKIYKKIKSPTHEQKLKYTIMKSTLLYKLLKIRDYIKFK